tara:strand:+ start:3540 stop:3719 length:180 start_codon:yes stop_codon:yes gene_type:complete
MVKLKKFPKRKVQKKRKQHNYYNGSGTSHERRAKVAKQAAGGCWWIEAFLRMYPNIIKK